MAFNEFRKGSTRELRPRIGGVIELYDSKFAGPGAQVMKLVYASDLISSTIVPPSRFAVDC